MSLRERQVRRTILLEVAKLKQGSRSNGRSTDHKKIYLTEREPSRVYPQTLSKIIKC